MKQHLSINDLNQLSEKGKIKLREWWKPEYGDFVAIKYYFQRKYREKIYIDELGYDLVDEVMGITDLNESALPLLSIGQLIQFLDEHNPSGKGFSKIDATKGTDGLNYFWVVVQYDKYYKELELCDSLWMAVKDILEKEE